MKHLRIDENRVVCCLGRLSYGDGRETSEDRRAFLHGDLLCFRLEVPRQIGAKNAWVSLRCDADGTVLTVPLKWCGMRANVDLWEGKTDTLPVGLYFLRGEVESLAGHLVALPKMGDTCGFYPIDHRDQYPYQLTVCDFAYEAPQWVWGGIVYQIFVDRFYRGEDTPLREGAILNPDWENGIPQFPKYPGAPLANNMFFGGNLDGVRKKLDYIASLGVSCIYLSPIFEATSNHKYDTGDYMTVDAAFGGEEALARLIEEAGERGIRIVLDGVFNHTGDDSIYFNRRGRYDSLGAYQSRQSPYFGWYDFQSHPDRYTCWWDIPILPRIHTERPECRDYFLGEGGVIEKYARMGIGGFRLDVADELPDTFLDGMKEKLSSIRPDSVLWGEVWEDASQKIAYGRRRRYFQGKQLDGVMNYPLRKGLIRFLKEGKTRELEHALCTVMANAPKRILNSQLNLFGTHDTVRILTELGGEGEKGRTNAELSVARLTVKERQKGLALLRLAYLILATVPGVPMIYYGDEVGMEGYSDPFNRLPFPWHRMDEALLEHFRRVGEMRRSCSVYREGDFRLLVLREDLLAFVREDESGDYMTVVNMGCTNVRLLSDTPMRDLLGRGRGARKVTLKPLVGSVFLLKKDTKIVFER